MELSNKTYDALKKIALFAVPISDFILLLAREFGFSAGASIATVVTGFGVLLGACLEISSRHYYAGGDDDAGN